MLIKDRMTKPPITAPPGMPIQEALKLMRERGIRRLPVVDKKGKLIGIVSDRDLLHASPSDATSLSVWELNYLISKVTLKDVMTKNVITVTPETPVQEAARIMAEKKIGGLPVVQSGKVIGVITETDLFRVLLELLPD